MFLQLVVGGVPDPDGGRRPLERWIDEVAIGAEGWLGSTGGITPDGRSVVATRFISREAATAASRRSEHLAGPSTSPPLPPLTVLETEDVTVVEARDPGEAGFVQVMRAAVRDRSRLETLEAEIGPAFVEFRPDFLAGYRAWFHDGTMAALDYFRSESEARAGESREMPSALRDGFSEWLSLVEGADWYDLLRPWHATPSSPRVQGGD